MNLQQLRFLNEIVRQGLNISDAASALYTSQPGVSKQIKLLEEELGIEIFVRNGKRIVAITEPGKAVLEIAQRMLHDAGNLKQVAEEFHSQDSGSLTIATTHTQARYALPPTVKQFIKRYPGVKLGLHQGSPTQIAEQVLGGEADIGIATESLALYDDLVTLPCYEWNHCVITPPNHPLLNEKKLTLGEDRAISDHYLRFRVHRAQQDQRRVRGGQHPAQHRADSDRCGRDQDLCGTGIGDRDTGEDGLHPRARQTPAHDGRRAPVQAQHHAHRDTPERIPARLHLRFHRAVRPAPDPRSGRQGDARFTIAGVDMRIWANHIKILLVDCNN